MTVVNLPSSGPGVTGHWSRTIGWRVARHDRPSSGTAERPVSMFSPNEKKALCRPAPTQSVRRAGVGDAADRIVAGRIIVAVLEEIHVVPEPGESEDVLQVVPRQPAERPANDITQNDDPQRHGVHPSKDLS